MGWLTRGRKRYFYRSVRTGRAVRRVYAGTGEAAELAALEDTARRAEARAWRDERSRLAAADAALDRLADVARAFADANCLLGGFRKHARGEWRRRRGA